MNLKSLLRGTFRAGVSMKGIDGLLEAIGGVLLWFIKPSEMSWTIQTLCQHELSRDPHDFVAAHLLHVSERLAHGNPIFASIYLLSHGLVKVLLAVALWLDELWAYPLAIVIFTCLFTFFGKPSTTARVDQVEAGSAAAMRLRNSRLATGGIICSAPIIITRN